MCKTRPDTKGRQSMFFDLCIFKKYLLGQLQLIFFTAVWFIRFRRQFLREDLTHSHILDSSLLKRKTIYRGCKWEQDTFSEV